jgi:hypothetical protein
MSSFGLLIFPIDKIANGVLCDGVHRLSKYQLGWKLHPCVKCDLSAPLCMKLTSTQIVVNISCTEINPN